MAGHGHGRARWPAWAGHGHDRQNILENLAANIFGGILLKRYFGKVGFFVVHHHRNLHRMSQLPRARFEGVLSVHLHFDIRFLGNLHNLLWSGSAHRQVITKPKDLQRAAGGHSGRDVICRLCNTPALEESNLALDASVQKCSLDDRKASTCSNS